MIRRGGVHAALHRASDEAPTSSALRRDARADNPSRRLVREPGPIGHRQLVLGVSEQTLLPIVVPAAPIATVVPRLRVQLGEVLRALGVPNADIEDERLEMESVAYGKTSNRRVLGVMVDFAKALPFYLPGGSSLVDVSLELASTPCSPLFTTTVSPDRTTTALFRP